MSKNIKIVTIGDGNTSKSSTLISYATNSFPNDYQPTVFDNYSAQVVVDGTIYTLGLWDSSGQSDYDHMRPLAYPHTDVFLITYSTVYRPSFDNVFSKWLPELMHHMPDTPWILVGTKSDIVDAPLNKCVTKDMVEEKLKEIDKSDAYATFRGHIVCSALTQAGLKLVFDTAIRVCLKSLKTNKSTACCIVM